MTNTEIGVLEVSPGLWCWRARHPRWEASCDWEPVVTSTVVHAKGRIIVVDPLAPPDDADEVWERLDREPPTDLVVLKPDHIRDVDRFHQRYGARAWGPIVHFKDDIPETDVAPIMPSMRLPGGLLVLDAGRWGQETPLWLPEQRALVFADAFTERDGVLRLWSTPWDESGPRAALGRLATLPVDRVIISHGSPLHDRAALELALTLPPWQSSDALAWIADHLDLDQYRRLGLGHPGPEPGR